MSHTETETDVADGCHSLEERSDDACASDRCQQARDDGREYSFSVAVRESPDYECALQLAKRLGEVERSDEEERSIVVVGRWDELEPLLGSAVVDFTTECVEEACGCDAHDESACASDAFCWGHYGVPMEDGCFTESTFAVCVWVGPEDGEGFSCIDIERDAIGPEGRCWSFPHWCEQPGFRLPEPDEGELCEEQPDCD